MKKLLLSRQEKGRHKKLGINEVERWLQIHLNFWWSNLTREQEAGIEFHRREGRKEETIRIGLKVMHSKFNSERMRRSCQCGPTLKYMKFGITKRKVYQNNKHENIYRKFTVKQRNNWCQDARPRSITLQIRLQILSKISRYMKLQERCHNNIQCTGE